MLQSFQIVGQQVFILFILMAVGFAARKVKILTEGGIKCITELMLYVVTPCLFINSFQMDYDPSLMRGFFISAAAAIVCHLLAMGLGLLIVRDKDKARRSVFRFGIVFSNCGYMSLPLQQALLGSEAVFYGASYIAAFNIFLWTYGLGLMCNGKERISVKKAIINPGTLSVIVGLLLFFFSIDLPVVIGKPIEYLSALNTPVPMMIIGYHIANLDFRKVLRTKGEFIMLAGRLLIMPILMLGALYLLGIRGTLLVSCVISASAPMAAMGTMFASKYGGEAELSASCVATSTLLSIITMTLIVGFASFVAF